MNRMIGTLLASRGLGTLVSPVTPVSGGFMHRMYRAETAQGSFAVKHLNPEVMKRPEAMGNFRRAETLERILEDAGIPVVPALILGGCKMQELEGEYFYIFRWHDGSITDWNSITREQCRLAGNIQGRIHAVQPARETGKQPELSSVDWARYIRQAENRHSALTDLLNENLPLLNEAQEKLNRARLALPDLECITDEDMDPKNVMWMNGRPAVIDLECLDYGNPVSHVLQLSLQWAGITICSLDPDKQRVFLEGWLEAYDPGFRDFAGILGLAYTWIEWLEFNIRRALGQCRDEKERALGEQEVRNTVNRIRYLREMEHAIRQQLDGMF